MAASCALFSVKSLTGAHTKARKPKRQPPVSRHSDQPAAGESTSTPARIDKELWQSSLGAVSCKIADLSPKTRRRQALAGFLLPKSNFPQQNQRTSVRRFPCLPFWPHLAFPAPLWRAMLTRAGSPDKALTESAIKAKLSKPIPFATSRTL